jgi:hypothetical protein
MKRKQSRFCEQANTYLNVFHAIVNHVCVKVNVGANQGTYHFLIAHKNNKGA